jgi:hypothetical protein
MVISAKQYIFNWQKMTWFIRKRSFPNKTLIEYRILYLKNGFECDRNECLFEWTAVNSMKVISCYLSYFLFCNNKTEMFKFFWNFYPF